MRRYYIQTFITAYDIQNSYQKDKSAFALTFGVRKYGEGEIEFFGGLGYYRKRA